MLHDSEKRIRAGPAPDRRASAADCRPILPGKNICFLWKEFKTEERIKKSFSSPIVIKNKKGTEILFFIS
jgi:hypothetical protein